MKTSLVKCHSCNKENDYNEVALQFANTVGFKENNILIVNCNHCNSKIKLKIYVSLSD